MEGQMSLAVRYGIAISVGFDCLFFCWLHKKNSLKQPIKHMKNNIRYGPGGDIYRIVTTCAQTGGKHFALDCTNEQARMLAIFTPGNIEGYFDFGLPLDDGSIPSEAYIIERINALGPKFNVKLVEGISPL